MNGLGIFPIWKKSKSKHRLYHYECDKNGNIRVVTLMNLLQVAAQKHISKMGYSVEEFAQKFLAWIATKYYIKVTRFPRVDEKITIKTWVSEKNKLTAIREFLVTDSKGRVLIEVSSKWGLIDFNKKRPVELPSVPVFRKKLFSTGFTLSCLKRVDRVDEFPVNYDHIDFNQHVNNSFYLLWATESVNQVFRSAYSPKEITVSFQNEAVYGDSVVVSTQEECGTRTVHSITSKNTGKELTKLTIKWC